MPDVTVTLTQTQVDAGSVLPNGLQDWAEKALRNKTNSLIDSLVKDYSDKQPDKIDDAEKEIIVGGIDLEKEKDKRDKGK